MVNELRKAARFLIASIDAEMRLLTAARTEAVKVLHSYLAPPVVIAAVKTKAKKVKAKRARTANGQTTALLMTALKDGPLHVNDVVIRMKVLGWVTYSTKPYGTISARLTQLAKAGKVVKIGMATFGLPQATQEELERAS